MVSNYDVDALCMLFRQSPFHYERNDNNISYHSDLIKPPRPRPPKNVLNF